MTRQSTYPSNFADNFIPVRSTCIECDAEIMEMQPRGRTPIPLRVRCYKCLATDFPRVRVAEGIAR